MRSRFAALLSLLVVGFGAAGIGAVGLAAPAHAEDAYAYWLYYTVEDGKFAYQDSAGPGKFVPKDGDVEAYRFAAAVFPPTQEPRADLDEVGFDAVCGDATAEDGEKRVAVLLDYGLESDATGGDEVPDPRAECAVVAEDATGLQVLSEVAETRMGDQASLCAIDGYPGTGCFEAADQVSPDDKDPVEFTIAGSDSPDSASGAGTDESGDEDGNALLIGGAAVVVVLLGAGGILLNRRRASD